MLEENKNIKEKKIFESSSLFVQDVMLKHIEQLKKDIRKYQIQYDVVSKDIFIKEHRPDYDLENREPLLEVKSSLRDKISRLKLEHRRYSSGHKVLGMFHIEHTQ